MPAPAMRCPLLLLLLLVALCFSSLAPTVLGRSLPEAVTVEGIMAHLAQFDQIATIGGLNSRSVRNNYNASAEYVFSQLAPYCSPRRQYFKVVVHQELEKPQLALVAPYETPFQFVVDFQGMRNGGTGRHNITAAVTHVAGGCKVADFAGFPRGSIALIQEGGDCELYESAFLAEDHGAVAIFFYNSQTRTTYVSTRVRITAWKEGDRLVEKPVLWLSNIAGKVLLSQPGATVQLFANQLSTIETTYNVICDSPTGSKDSVIVMGAHLDSVPEGPGLNDNASGSSTVLEIALQFFKTAVQNKNAVRFAWWGAEEIGLFGSRHYVRDLLENDPGEFARIALYINFDMMGGPNFITQIHDSYDVSVPVSDEIMDASYQIQTIFESYFKGEDLPFELTAMAGGSDYLPFIEAGIPSNGMATGASGIKSPDQHDTFGGLANAAYDPCYHQYCDTIENVSQESIRLCSQAASLTLEKLATMDDLRSYLGISSKHNHILL